MTEVNEYSAGQFYTARDAGPLVEFWDADVLLFSVPACLAANQAQRDGLAKLWGLAVEAGRSQGREEMKHDLRRLIGI